MAHDSTVRMRCRCTELTTVQNHCIGVGTAWATYITHCTANTTIATTAYGI